MEKKIKTIKSFTSYHDSPEENYLNSFIEYDQAGNVIKTEAYSGSNELESKTETKYNEEGKIISEINYMSLDEVSEELIYERNAEGNISKITVKYADGSYSIKTYTRTDNDKSVQIEITDDEGEFEGREFFKLNDKGEILEKKIIDYNESIEEYQVNEFNDFGKIAKQTEYSEDGLEFETIFKYNDNQQLVSRIKINRNKELVEKINLKYDDKGNVTEQLFNDSYLIKLDYNEQGEVIREERINSQGLTENLTESIFNEDNLLQEEVNGIFRVVYKYEFFD